MAVYWILELLPLPVTALLPLVLLPLAGVASTDEVARNYLKVSPRHKLGICCTPFSLMFRLFMSLFSSTLRKCYAFRPYAKEKGHSSGHPLIVKLIAVDSI